MEAKKIKPTTGQKKLLVQLDQRTEALTRKDIGAWRKAWQAAINIDNPLRGPLLDIYRDTLIDDRVTGAIEQRKNFVLQKKFKIVDPSSGEEVKDITQIFETAWFKQALSYILDALFYGHSLIELGDVIERDGAKAFNGVTLIPRTHIIPEYGIFTKEPNGLVSEGIAYREAPYIDWLIEAGEKDALGLLLKCAPHAISKRHVSAYWDTFAEIFGMPVRVAKVDTRDPKEVEKAEELMEKQGAETYMIADRDTEIEFVETSRGDAYNVYDKRIARAEKAIAIILIGQTMTLDNGASKSQSETHMKVLEKLVKADADMLRDVINDQIIPKCVKHGILSRPVRFDWDNTINLTPEQQQEAERMLLENYEIDPEYFERKYNVKITGHKRMAEPSPTREDSKRGKTKEGKSLIYDPNFFD